MRVRGIGGVGGAPVPVEGGAAGGLGQREARREPRVRDARRFQRVQRGAPPEHLRDDAALLLRLDRREGVDALERVAVERGQRVGLLQRDVVDGVLDLRHELGRVCRHTSRRMSIGAGAGAGQSHRGPALQRDHYRGVCSAGSELAGARTDGGEHAETLGLELLRVAHWPPGATSTSAVVRLSGAAGQGMSRAPRENPPAAACQGRPRSCTLPQSALPAAECADCEEVTRVAAARAGRGAGPPSCSRKAARGGAATLGAELCA